MKTLKRLEYEKQWRATHKEHSALYMRQYRKDNPSVGRKACAKWRLKNIEARRAYLAEYNTLRKLKQKKATPSWADKDLIRDMYLEAQYQGLEIDHMVPITSDKVCGLHCESNLQLLPKLENRIKNNKHWPNQ